MSLKKFFFLSSFIMCMTSAHLSFAMEDQCFDPENKFAENTDLYHQLGKSCETGKELKISNQVLSSWDVQNLIEFIDKENVYEARSHTITFDATTFDDDAEHELFNFPLDIKTIRFTNINDLELLASIIRQNNEAKRFEKLYFGSRAYLKNLHEDSLIKEVPGSLLDALNNSEHISELFIGPFDSDVNFSDLFLSLINNRSIKKIYFQRKNSSETGIGNLEKDEADNLGILLAANHSFSSFGIGVASNFVEGLSVTLDDNQSMNPILRPLSEESNFKSITVRRCGELSNDEKDELLMLVANTQNIKCISLPNTVISSQNLWDVSKEFLRNEVVKEITVKKMPTNLAKIHINASESNFFKPEPLSIFEKRRRGISSYNANAYAYHRNGDMDDAAIFEASSSRSPFLILEGNEIAYAYHTSITRIVTKENTRSNARNIPASRRPRYKGSRHTVAYRTPERAWQQTVKETTSYTIGKESIHFAQAEPRTHEQHLSSSSSSEEDLPHKLGEVVGKGIKNIGQSAKFAKRRFANFARGITDVLGSDSSSSSSY